MEYWRYRLLKPPISLNTLFYSLPAVDSLKHDKLTGPKTRKAQSILLSIQQTFNLNQPFMNCLRSHPPIHLASLAHRFSGNWHRQTSASAHIPRTRSTKRSMANTYNTERTYKGVQGLNQKHQPLDPAVNLQPTAIKISHRVRYISSI